MTVTNTFDYGIFARTLKEIEEAVCFSGCERVVRAKSLGSTTTELDYMHITIPLARTIGRKCFQVNKRLGNYCKIHLAQKY